MNFPTVIYLYVGHKLTQLIISDKFDQSVKSQTALLTPTTMFTNRLGN